MKSYIIQEVNVEGFDANGVMDKLVYFADLDLPSESLPLLINREFIKQGLNTAEVTITLDKKEFNRHKTSTLDAEMEVFRGDLGIYCNIRIPEAVIEGLKSKKTVNFEYHLIEEPTTIEIREIRGA